MSKFYCSETGETLIVNKEIREDTIQSGRALGNLLLNTPEQYLKPALERVLEENPKRLLRIAQAVHGRLYEAMRENL